MNAITLTDQEKEIIKEFKLFRKTYTASCNSIRLDEVAQYVLFKLGKYGKVTETIKSGLGANK